MSFINYTPSIKTGGYCGFPAAGLIAAHGNGTRFFTLYKIKPIRRSDGKSASYSLHDCVLTKECDSVNDEAFVAVKYDEFFYYTRKEMENVLMCVAKGESLFDLFSYD